MNDYVEEIHESEQVRTSTIKSFILDAKYENPYLNKVTKNRCQHIKEIQLNKLLKLLQRLKYCFGETLRTWKTYPVDFQLT